MLWGMTLKEARKARGLTQAQLVKILPQPGLPGVGQSTVAKWETGALVPSLAYQLRLATVLGVSHRRLFR